MLGHHNARHKHAHTHTHAQMSMRSGISRGSFSSITKAAVRRSRIYPLLQKPLLQSIGRGRRVVPKATRFRITAYRRCRRVACLPPFLCGGQQCTERLVAQETMRDRLPSEIQPCRGCIAVSPGGRTALSPSIWLAASFGSATMQLRSRNTSSMTFRPLTTGIEASNFSLLRQMASERSKQARKHGRDALHRKLINSSIRNGILA